MRSAFLTIPALLCAAALAAPGPSAAEGGGNPPLQIVVEAEGTAYAPPDIAMLVLGVEHKGDTARAALDAMNRDLAAVFDRLAASGIAPADMQTSGLRLYPYAEDYAGRVAAPREGFVAGSDVTVRVRDLAGLGALLDAVVSDGANLFRSLEFGIANPGPLLDEARRRAVAEARRKAALYAEAADIPLGPILSLSESGGGFPVPMMRAAADSAPPVPVAGGEVGLTVRVTLGYGPATD